MTTAIASGLGATLGWGVETPGAYGTTVVPTVFGTHQKNGIKRKNTIVQDQSLYGGLSNLGSRRSLVAQMATGDIAMGLYDRGLGKIFAQMMGSTPVVTAGTGGAAGTYTTVHQPGDTTGKSLTLQAGKPQTNGTLVPFTWGGCKITAWTIEVKAKNNATLTFTVAAQTELLTVAYTAPSYVASNLYSALESSAITLGGTASTASGVLSVAGGTPASAVTGFKISGKLSLDEDRFYLGSAGLMAEPITNGFWTLSGEIDAEFANTTDLYVPWANQTGLPLQFSLTGPTIAGSTHSSLGLICPLIFLNDAPPTIDGPQVLKVSAPFDALSDGQNPWFQLTTVSLDATV